MSNRTTILAGALALAALGAPAQAGTVALAAASLPLLQVNAADNAIIRSFRSVLGRNPSERELLRYRALMLRYGWTENDVRTDLSGRNDYRKYRNDTGTRPNAAVRSAYLDILGREPDPDGLREYRQRIVRDGWTEQDVREALRKSDEYASIRTASADRIVRRAYLDVLRREPDPEGLAAYRQQVIENGWEFHDVRQALMRSPERRQTHARDARGGRAGDGPPRLRERPAARARPDRLGRVHRQGHARALDPGPAGAHAARKRRVPQHDPLGAGGDPPELAVVLVRHDVERAVGPLADVADALPAVGQQVLLRRRRGRSRGRAARAASP